MLVIFDDESVLRLSRMSRPQHRQSKYNVVQHKNKINNNNKVIIYNKKVNGGRRVGLYIKEVLKRLSTVNNPGHP